MNLQGIESTIAAGLIEHYANLRMPDIVREILYCMELTASVRNARLIIVSEMSQRNKLVTGELEIVDNGRTVFRMNFMGDENSANTFGVETSGPTTTLEGNALSDQLRIITSEGFGLFRSGDQISIQKNTVNDKSFYDIQIDTSGYKMKSNVPIENVLGADLTL
jgi:hypothetical protein